MKTLIITTFSVLLLILFSPTLTSAQNEKKAVYAILIDNTGSLEPQLGNIQLLSKVIVENKSQNGVFSIFNFQTDNSSQKPTAVATAGTEWSQDKNVLEKYIDSLTTAVGQTALFDAVLLAGRTIATKAEAEKLTEKRQKQKICLLNYLPR